MTSLAELARRHSKFNETFISHLQGLTRSWGLLADLSFSDLLLYSPIQNDAGISFVLLGHIRPTTTTTLYRADLVGQIFEPEQRPLVAETYESSGIKNGTISVSHDRQINATTIPVTWQGKTIGVLASEKPQLADYSRSEMERTYFSVFKRFTEMVERGQFPYKEEERFQYRTPRVGDGLLLVDEAGRIEFASPNAVSLLHRLGWARAVVGSKLDETGLSPRILSEAFSRKSSVTDELEKPDNTCVVSHCFPLLDSEKATGAAVLIRDVTELRRRDRQLISKDATIREVHHRVKNNLQTISSLLRLQARRLDSIESQAALNESVRRIGAIAVVHETLAVSSEGQVTFGEVMRPLVELVEEGLSSPLKPISIEIDGDTGLLPSEVTTTLAVVVTELLQNALDHAFKNFSENIEVGKVLVELRQDENFLEVKVSDNGAGLPDVFNIDSQAGLGLTIVRTFVEGELGGRLVINSDSDMKGTTFEILIPAVRLLEK
mgnify:CR=1 FL=1